MNTIRHATLMFSLAAVLILPGLAKAQEAVPAAPAATLEQVMPAPVPAMGPGMGMRYGAMHGENCMMHKGGMMGGSKPCMTGPNPGCGCRMDDMDNKRLDMLEKRMDMMQMMLEMMMKQSAGSKP